MKGLSEYTCNKCEQTIECFGDELSKLQLSHAIHCDGTFEHSDTSGNSHHAIVERVYQSQHLRYDSQPSKRAVISKDNRIVKDEAEYDQWAKNAYK